MPYGEPTLRANMQYSMRARHTDGATIFTVVENDGTDEEKMDSGLQALVDLINTAPGWTLLAASKGYEGGADCTPSA